METTAMWQWSEWFSLGAWPQFGLIPELVCSTGFAENQEWSSSGLFCELPKPQYAAQAA
jgi:hypothetical protein